MILSMMLPVVILAQKIPSRPSDATPAQKLWLGQYVASDTLVLGEKNGTLQLGPLSGTMGALHKAQDREWEWTSTSFSGARRVTVHGSSVGRPDSILIDGQAFRRRPLAEEDGVTFRIDPLFSGEELIHRAKAAKPPVEQGTFRPTDLVELHSLDSTIRYDIRYASTNNFMGQQFYSLSRAYLQRPAAEAAVRAHAWLRAYGYGLLVHDAYRPWSVTKMFWDATPDAMKEVFVANPSKGSRHNRGCAIDATLYHLGTGVPADMVGGYDEFSERAFPHYPGGTSLQRWHRELLKAALEREGFTQYEWEWWHFDFAGWDRWMIGVVSFEELENE
ncbi:MAG: M15 family metallopeptidase [Bacteroidetes bacterium]|jgi:D-alanyl-D-alanine dipeptidase|nr:M15 family metallopeptidase [Bacteroidota bacterium]